MLHRKMHQNRCKTGEKSLKIQLLRGRNQSLEYGTMVLQFRNGLPGTLKTEERFLTVSDEEFHELQRGDDLQ